MTAAARSVLADCQAVLQLLEGEVDLDRWRVQWVTAVTLIRAVGHVLDKVDGRNPKIKKVAKEFYRSWRATDGSHKIFVEFIDQERNNVLKEYAFGYHSLEKVDIAILSTLQSPSGEFVRSAEVIGISDNVYRPLLGCFRSGDDARDVYSDAISWWEAQLRAIDSAVEGVVS